MTGYPGGGYQVGQADPYGSGNGGYQGGYDPYGYGQQPYPDAADPGAGPAGQDETTYGDGTIPGPRRDGSQA